MDTIMREHIDAWTSLWRPAFYMSPSLAPGALNMALINATRYALLSNERAPLHEHGVTVERRRTAERALQATHMCYSTHNTL